MGNKSDSLSKARGYAFLLLKFRLRSESELRERLFKKKFDIAIIDETIRFLKGHSFIDDSAFARIWIESRLKKPLGINRLKHELRQKGIDSAIIENSARELTKDYSESGIVGKIVKERLKRLESLGPQKARQRIYAYLLRRGFSPEIISEEISNQCNQAY